MEYYNSIGEEGVRRNLKDNPWDIIDRFRGKVDGINPLGDKVPKIGDGTGTVAFVDQGQDGVRKVFGVNSSLISDESKNLGREVFQKMQSEGLLTGAKSYGNGAAQVLTHAESHALMRMWERSGKTALGEVVMYVDRFTCANCRKYIPEVMQALGVTKLTVYTKQMETIIFP
jgi:hypothetical protein